MLFNAKFVVADILRNCDNIIQTLFCLTRDFVNRMAFLRRTSSVVNVSSFAEAIRVLASNSTTHLSIRDQRHDGKIDEFLRQLAANTSCMQVEIACK
jgi:hypothetical protein